MAVQPITPNIALPNMQPFAGQTVFVSFSAMVLPDTTQALIAALTNCVTGGAAEIRLLLSTPGGSVMHGITLYNFIRGLPVRVVTHNAGNVDSIGNAIFLSGDHRIASPHSTFMFHGVAFEAAAGQIFDERLLSERLDSLLADQNRIGSIIAERTNLRPGQIKPLFRQAKTKDATYAMSAGIVHEIAEIDVPAGAPVISLVFQR